MENVFLGYFIDCIYGRNIGNARVFGFEKGLHLHGTDFNNLSTFFYVTYVVFETPWVMAVKKFGANRVLAVAFVCWSVTTLGTGFIQNYSQAIALRLLLGLFEAGLFPCLTFVISTIWNREDQGKRVAVLYGSSALSGAFGGLIAYGIQLMGERRGIAAWRWLFIIEGVISIVLCGIGWATLPKSAEEAWFLTAEERAVMRARKQRHLAYKGSSDEFSWKYAKMALTDPFIYVAGLCLFCASIPLFGFGTFLPTLIKGMGYTSLQANYLTIPVYILGCISLAGFSWTSDRLRKRAAIACIAPIPVVIGYAIVVGSANNAVGYFAMFLCAAGIYPYNTLLLTWVSNNLTPDYKRSVGLPLFVSIANISGLISSQIYPATDGPRYVTGNAVSLGMDAAAGLGVGLMWLMLKRREREKARVRASGMEDNGKEGDRALGFRYTL